MPITPSSFVHLSVRSYFSMKEGAFSPEELAHRAAALGMDAVALTDRNGLYGAARFAAACRDAGVRPIYGAALTVRTMRGDRSVTVLAKDDVGYANLCGLISAAHMTGERGDPALTAGQVCARAEGLVCLLGSGSEPGLLAVAGRADAGLDATRPYREAFGPDLLVEVVHRMEEGSEGEIRRLLALADGAGIQRGDVIRSPGFDGLGNVCLVGLPWL